MSKHLLKNRFESVFQATLFSLIACLLLLNLTSNYVFYRTWYDKKSETSADLGNIAFEISQSIKTGENKLSEVAQSRAIEQYQLETLIYIPSIPLSDSESEKRLWLSTIGPFLPTSEFIATARHILQNKPNSLIQGEDDTYYLHHQISSAEFDGILILGRNQPAMSQMDRTGKILLYGNVGVISLVLLLYLFLSRFIISPFKLMRKEAEVAGRTNPDSDDNVETVVEDYKNMISELRGKERELLALNKIVSDRANRLESFNQYLLSSMNSGLIGLNSEGKIQTLNHEAALILGLSSEKAIGQSLSNLLSTESAILLIFAKSFESELPQKYIEIDEIVAGKTYHLGLTTSPIHDESGNNIGLTIVIHDLTELTKLRLELESKNRLAAMGEMSAGLAHQLRNSVGAISGYGSLLKRKLSGDGTLPLPLEELQKECHEAELLIGKFLDFVRPFNFEAQQIDIAQFLIEFVAGYQSRINSDNNILVYKGPQNFEAAFDPLLLKQAIGNMVDNALIAYGGRAGTVQVSLSVHETEFGIIISDSAGGIKRSEVEKLFTPFYSSRPGGTGLGLSLAARIIDLHGGAISLDSVEGEGTSFSIKLPVKQSKNSSLLPESISISV